MCYLKMALRNLYYLVLSGLLSCGAPNDKAASPQGPETATFQQPTPATDRGSAVADVVVERDSLPPQEKANHPCFTKFDPALDSLAPEYAPQEPPFARIRPKNYGPRGYRIDFWADKPERLTKTLYLEEINPFNMLPFKKQGYSLGTHQYDLTGIDKATLERHLGPLPFSDSVWQENTPLYADGQIMVEEFITDFTVVSYNLYLSGPHDEVIAILGSYQVIDAEGNIINTIKTDRAGQPPVVPQDGKYLAVKYGGNYSGCGEGGSTPEGLAFYDVASGDKIYEEPFPLDVKDRNGEWIYYFAAHSYIVSINTTGWGMNKIYHYRIYDIQKRIKYERLFDLKYCGVPRIDEHADFDPDGIYYFPYSKENGLHERRKAFFDRNFISSKIKTLQ